MTGAPELELLERHRDSLSGSVCLVGAPDAFPGRSPTDAVHALTTHFGQWGRQGGHERGWYFGYDDPALPSGFDTVVVFMPKARDELNMRCAWALSRLGPGGEIWLVGAKRAGIAGGARRFLERFPKAYKADNARHCQLWKARAEEADRIPVFDTRDWIRPVREVVEGQTLSLFSLPGLFSEGRLDPGTRLLLETIGQRPRGPVLDVACGNGVIAAWLHRKWPDLELTLSDVQWQALVCARLAFGDTDRVPVIASDGLSQLGSGFGTIVTNPPFHQGVSRDTAVAEGLIRGAPDHLGSQGELRLVANAFLPYPRLIEQVFGTVSILADNGDFRVYRAHRERHSRKK